MIVYIPFFYLKQSPLLVNNWKKNNKANQFITNMWSFTSTCNPSVKRQTGKYLLIHAAEMYWNLTHVKQFTEMINTYIPPPPKKKIKIKKTLKKIPCHLYYEKNSDSSL